MVEQNKEMENKNERIRWWKRKWNEIKETRCFVNLKKNNKDKNQKKKKILKDRKSKRLKFVRIS